MTKYQIKPEERGHRAPLSPDEPTVTYTIKLRQSTAKILRKVGAKRVRKYLDIFAFRES